ncbi:putative ribonuclease H-like domain-containing protein [Tanacetum coccineum]|uniref:Ribonuclease H-like domain-containing protein n=1 Tax=Tanacetum coccineum TaxID=301880 RepID=A0ABQ5EQV5_9ASTR
MANIRPCRPHNMIACVEKTAHNADFYQIIDYLTGCSINYSLLVDPDLIGHIAMAQPFLMYPRFIQLFLDKQLEGVTRPQNFLPSVTLPSKVFTFMRKHSPKFSCRITPLTPPMLEVITALAAEEAHSTSPHSRAASSPRDAQGTPAQSAAQASISQGTAEAQGTADLQGTAEVQGTADSQGTAEAQGTADIPQSPNDYTPTDESQTSGGDEGLLDLYALNREVRRLKKQTISQAKQIHKLKAKLKKLSKGVQPVVEHHALWVKSQNLKKQKKRRKKQKKKVSSVKLGRNKDESNLSEEHHDQDDHHHTAFVYEDVDATEAVVTPAQKRKSEKQKRQSTVTPRTLNFEDEAGPSSPIRPTQEEESEEQFKDDEFLADLNRTRGLSIPGPMQSQPQQPTQATDPKEKEVARKVQAEWDAEEERKRLEALKKPKTISKKPTSLAQERTQMMNFLKGQGYKNLQKLRYPQMKELYDKVQESIKDSFKDFIPMGSKRKNQMLQEEMHKDLKEEKSYNIEKSAQDKESLEAISMIIEFKVIDSPDGEYLIIYRANSHYRAFDTLWEILHILDRQDLHHLYLVKNQEDWEIVRWRLNESSGVHTLELEDGTMIHMLTERRYPLSRELMNSDARCMVQAYKNTLQTLEQQKAWYQSNQLALEERIRILTADLENTTNMLKYTEKLNDQVKLEKLNDQVKLEESKARFDKWKESSKNLDKLINSSMSSRSKFGLGFGETFRSDKVFDPSAPSIFDTTPEDVEGKPLYDRLVKAVGMHTVPSPITGTFMPPSNKPELDDTQVTYGSKSNDYFEANSVSNDFVSSDNSDKSSDSETTGFASCVSSVKSSSSKTNEHLASASSSVDFKTVSKTADQKPSSTIDDPSFSFKENVKTPRNICNKNGINNRSHCKNNSFGSKTCFVCGSKFHLIKDCDFYEQQLGLYNKPMWHNVANIPSFVPRAAYVPAGSRNPPASVSAGSAFPAGSRNRPASISAGRPFSAGWRNHAARPMTRPTSQYFQHFRRPGCYNQLYMDKGRWGTAVKTSAGGTVTFGGGDGKIIGKGTIRTSKLNFENVYYVEELQNFNLFSISQICDKKNKVLFTDKECLVLTKEFQLPEDNITCLLAKASSEESTKWHIRMAHVNFKNINNLAKNGLVNGLPSKLFTNDHNCVACNKGKQHKASYKAIIAVSTISEPLQLLHMDLFGPTSIRSIDHKYYSMVITNDLSRFSWVFFLGTKDETYYILKDFITFIENQLNKKVKAIRCDNGTEFKNSKLIELCGSKGIKRDYSNARTSQQNGVAERKNRTLIEAARTMLVDSKFPTMFWTEAVSTAYYVLNRVLVTHPHNKTPYELLSGKVPNISHLKPFGCHVTILNTSDHLGKFAGKANQGFIVGYASHSTQDDSDSECDEQVIIAPSFPSNRFSGPKVLEASEMVESNSDYAEELSDMVPVGGIDPTASISTDTAEPFPTVIEPVHADEISLPPGYSLGSSEHSTRFPSPSDLANSISLSLEMEDIYHHPSTNIFSSSSYDADFGSTVTNLAPIVVVDPVPTKRVNTIHPQSQILESYITQVQTREH